jgi:hypothetical protein
LKKTIAILFLAIYLLCSTQLKELLKLPILVEHFIEHKQLDTKISFIEFLCMHYAHGNVKDADYEKDMKLPFKSAENSSQSSTSFYLPSPNFKPEIIVHFTEGKQQFSLYNFTYSSAFLSAIWQPPRVC